MVLFSSMVGVLIELVVTTFIELEHPAPPRRRAAPNMTNQLNDPLGAHSMTTGFAEPFSDKHASIDKTSAMDDMGDASKHSMPSRHIEMPRCRRILHSAERTIARL